MRFAEAPPAERLILMPVPRYEYVRNENQEMCIPSLPESLGTGRGDRVRDTIDPSGGVLKLSGELRIEDAGDLRAALFEFVSAAASPVVDLSGVTECDTAALPLLLSAARTTVRQMVTFPLQSAGFDVVEARDGQDALARLNDPIRLSMVVTDLNMPVMDGIGLIQKLRAHPTCKYVPIVVLTTESENAKKTGGPFGGRDGMDRQAVSP